MVNKCLQGHPETMVEDFGQTGIASFFPSTISSSYYTIVIHGDNSLYGAGPISSPYFLKGTTNTSFVNAV